MHYRWILANLQRSKAQFEKQFKKWNWEKKMTSDEWKYIAKRLQERGDRPTSVYFCGKQIPALKVKKEIPRYDLPTLIVSKANASKIFPPRNNSGLMID